MASYQVPLPKPFNFATPEEWPKWIQRFERFRQASGLNEKSSANQVNTLVYTMGDIADDILSSFGLSEEDKAKYDVVVEKFEAHFVKKRNVIFERAKFNQRRQKDYSINYDVQTLHHWDFFVIFLVVFHRYCHKINVIAIKCCLDAPTTIYLCVYFACGIYV